MKGREEFRFITDWGWNYYAEFSDGEFYSSERSFRISINDFEYFLGQTQLLINRLDWILFRTAQVQSHARGNISTLQCAKNRAILFQKKAAIKYLSRAH